MSSDTTPSSRAFVLGIDGLPWRLIERWATAGELPNFARLLEDGAGGPLESTTPATTALAWPSIATGVWPDDHGVYGFHRLQSDYTQQMNISEAVARPELWDLLSPAVVGNVPMTYPAKAIDGEMVTGMMTPETDEGFTQPTELASEIADRIPEYRIDVPWREYGDDPEAFVSEARSLVETRRELMDLLAERTDWRLCFFVYTTTDRLQHLVWDEAVLLDHYRHLDDVLGDVLEYVSRRDATLFVVSDHGFGPLSKTVHVNRIFEREGYLARRTNARTRGVLDRLGADKASFRAFLDRLGVDEQVLLERLPQRVVNAIAAQVPGDHALYDIDYEETLAFVHGPGNVYVNDAERFTEGWVDPARVDEIKQELRLVLSAVTDPETGKSALEVFDGEELFPRDDRAPDLVVEGADGYTVLPSLKDEAFAESEARNGGHRSEGVFLAWGPTIESGTTPTEASVVDVAPTVLRSVGAPVSEHFDGHPLDEILDHDSIQSAPASQTPERTREDSDSESDAESGKATDTDFESVEDRLRGLGYME